jgi:hypothetical protein
MSFLRIFQNLLLTLKLGAMTSKLLLSLPVIALSFGVNTCAEEKLKCRIQSSDSPQALLHFTS